MSTLNKATIAKLPKEFRETPLLPAVFHTPAQRAETLKQYTDGLLTSAGGDRTEADWAGNGLKGHYSSAAGKTSAVLVFTVADRPLAGFIYQLNSNDQAAATTI